MKKNLLLHFILTFMLFAIIGCVGTIQNAEEDITKSKSYTDYGITFKGIEEAVAVAHNKVDISFSGERWFRNFYLCSLSRWKF